MFCIRELKRSGVMCLDTWIVKCMIHDPVYIMIVSAYGGPRNGQQNINYGQEQWYIVCSLHGTDLKLGKISCRIRTVAGLINLAIVQMEFWMSKHNLSSYVKMHSEYYN